MSGVAGLQATGDHTLKTLKTAFSERFQPPLSGTVKVTVKVTPRRRSRTARGVWTSETRRRTGPWVILY